MDQQHGAGAQLADGVAEPVPGAAADEHGVRAGPGHVDPGEVAGDHSRRSRPLAGLGGSAGPGGGSPLLPATVTGPSFTSRLSGVRRFRPGQAGQPDGRDGGIRQGRGPPRIPRGGPVQRVGRVGRRSDLQAIASRTARTTWLALRRSVSTSTVATSR